MSSIRAKFSIGLIVFLAACANQPTTILNTCPIIHDYTAAEEAQIYRYEQSLPADSLMIFMLEDYERMRNAARACH